MQLFLLDLSRWLTANTWVVPVVGLFVCGLSFVLGWRMSASRSAQKAAAESVEGLDANFLGGVTRDRRVAPRRRGNTVEVHLRSLPDDPPIRAWVVDRSIGGLCLVLDQPLEEGLVLKVRPKLAPESLPWSEITVRSCRDDGGQYEVGCQFLRLPTWSEMLQFG